MSFGGSIGRAGANIIWNTIGKVPIMGKDLSTSMKLTSKNKITFIRRY
jgi:hypothetical protein